MIAILAAGGGPAVAAAASAALQKHRDQSELADCLAAVGAFKNSQAAWGFLNSIEDAMLRAPHADEIRPHLRPGETAYGVIDCPAEHLFTPGLYRRTFRAPAGSFSMSQIHATKHPFVITRGVVLVCGIAGGKPSGVVKLTAPHHGVTEPMTRRFLFFKEATEWVTYHATNRTTPEEVEKDILIVRGSITMGGKSLT